mmetsp:Transcript_72601/g.201280  ORF Transcript_72601/g.201280 Transcript_72601/m.201280 type:complete len:223 (+) Transcript_72601:625-1293(+)
MPRGLLCECRHARRAGVRPLPPALRVLDCEEPPRLLPLPHGLLLLRARIPHELEQRLEARHPLLRRAPAQRGQHDDVEDAAKPELGRRRRRGLELRRPRPGLPRRHRRRGLLGGHLHGARGLQRLLPASADGPAGQEGDPHPGLSSTAAFTGGCCAQRCGRRLAADRQATSRMLVLVLRRAAWRREVVPGLSFAPVQRVERSLSDRFSRAPEFVHARPVEAS